MSPAGGPTTSSLCRARRQAGAVTAEYAMVAVGAVLFGALFLVVVRLPVVHDLLLLVFLRLFGWLFELHILGWAPTEPLCTPGRTSGIRAQPRQWTHPKPNHQPGLNV